MATSVTWLRYEVRIHVATKLEGRFKSHKTRTISVVLHEAHHLADQRPPAECFTEIPGVAKHAAVQPTRDTVEPDAQRSRVLGKTAEPDAPRSPDSFLPGTRSSPRMTAAQYVVIACLLQSLVGLGLRATLVHEDASRSNVRAAGVGQPDPSFPGAPR